ncbi:hypothetical protein ACTIVE_7671, partial [Actinomadura verrucosospora]
MQQHEVEVPARGQLAPPVAAHGGKGDARRRGTGRHGTGERGGGGRGPAGG